MNIFKVLFKHKAEVKQKPNYNFSDLDRINSAKLRKISSEIKQTEKEIQLRQRQQELDELQEELGDYEEEEEQPQEQQPNLEALFTSLIAGAIAKKQQQPLQQQQQKQNLTDKEIKALVEKVPKRYLKLNKGIDISTFKKLILSYMPNLSEDSINRAYRALQNT